MIISRRQRTEIDSKRRQFPPMTVFMGSLFSGESILRRALSRYDVPPAAATSWTWRVPSYHIQHTGGTKINGERILHVGMDLDSKKIAMAAIDRFGNDELSELVLPGLSCRQQTPGETTRRATGSCGHHIGIPAGLKKQEDTLSLFVKKSRNVSAGLTAGPGKQYTKSFRRLLQ